MQRARVGSIEIIALVDNVMAWPATSVFPAATRQQLAAWASDLSADGQLALNFGCFLLRDGSTTVLVDTGWGPEFNGHLLDELAAAGIDSSTVDTVVFTHLHGDHTGWNIDRESGKPLFPRARFLVPKADFEHYGAEDPPNESFQRDIAPLMALNNVQLIEDGHAISASLRCVATPGHTPGHTSIAIESGGEAGFILGDVVLSTIDARDLELVNSFDSDWEIAAETRRTVVADLVAKGSLVGASHITAPGLGRFVRRGSATAWEALPLQDAAPR